MTRLEKLVRPHILELKPYSTARDDFNQPAQIFLDANENAFGSVPPGEYHRYPDPHQIELKAKLSRLYHLDASWIFIGNGSDEPIELLIRAFCKPGEDRIIICPPTYGMYKISAQVNEIDIASIPLTLSIQPDINRIKSEVTPQDKIIFLCSPNNPTGNTLNRSDLLDICRFFDGLVVIDEAYIDFSSEPGMLEYVGELENLVILRTFSKAWGLAGIRLGMAIANPFVIEVLNKIKPPYNINQATQEIASHALEMTADKEETVNKIIKERSRLRQCLDEFPFVQKIFPSESNFLLIRFQDHLVVNEKLKSRGIIVRDRSHELYCDSCLRITVGTNEENNQLLDSLKELT